MIKVKRTYDEITFVGHAEDHDVCNKVSTLIVALLQNLQDRLHDAITYELIDGRFYLSTQNLSIEGDIVLESIWYAILRLAEDYPNSFNIDTDI